MLRQVPRTKDAATTLAVYSQRHFIRVNTLLHAAYFLDFTFRGTALARHLNHLFRVRSAF